ncbi:MAG: hypothetical protein HYU66_22650 [Armatimonadetes bacterium]|nr:hypothetical protein [Armatimonadota bacterium]
MLVRHERRQFVESSYNAADELTGTQTFGPAVASESAFEPFTRAPYSRNAFALNLPLAAGRRYTIEDATLSLVGATGTWDAFQSAGAGTVSLSPGVQVDSDDTPVLSLAVSKVAAPNLLAASGSVRVTSQEKQGETAYGYDANGNTTSEVSAAQSVTLTWDGENRLLTVETDGETETYAYAATGLRRKKTTGAGTTHFVWDNVNLLAELDAALATLAQYTDWPGQWGGLSSARRSGSSQFFGFDLSANTRALMDAAAGVTDSYLYSAFGTEVVTSGSSINPFRFGGQARYYRDAAKTLQVSARVLSPGLGRWFSRDPAGDGRREYSYCWPSPTSCVDPTGLASLETRPVAGAPGFKHHFVRFGRACEVQTGWTIAAGSGIGFLPGFHTGLIFTGGAIAIAGAIGLVKLPGWWKLLGAGAILLGVELGLVGPGDYEEEGCSPRKVYATRIDLAFERALCNCVQASLSKPPPWYWAIGNSCATWANRMWDCARRATASRPSVK